MHMLRQTVLVTGVLLIVWFGGRALWFALSSDEDQIAWVLDDMVDGFNEARMRPVIGGFARHYTDESSDATREEVRQALAGLFFGEVDPRTKAFLLHVELDTDDLPIELTPGTGGEPARAKLVLHPRFTTRKSGTEELYWDASVHVEMAETEDGWQIVRTSQVNHADRRDD